VLGLLKNGVDFLDTKFKSLIVIPVINELENLKVLIPKILKNSNSCNILIVDDNSKDGTQEYLSNLREEKIFVVFRPGKFGLGSAHALGLKFAIEKNYSFAITMDGDQTHDPQYIDEILVCLSKTDVDLVLTSRFLDAGGIQSWNLFRKALTHLGHILTLILFRTSKDLTSGMRGYKVSSVELAMLDWLKDSNYEFLPKSFYYYKRKKLKTEQLSIVLPKRAYGSSKNNFVLMLKNALAILVTPIYYHFHFRG
jgi:dolichol-phosphate mannosyltransferase